MLLGGHTILEVARDSLFLSRLSATQLPATYLMIAVGATVAAQIDARLMRGLDDRRVLSATLVLGSVGALVFSGLFATEATWVPHAYYVWTGSIATVAIAQFWRLNSEIFTVSSAKRFLAPIGAGGAVGAIAGAGAAELALNWVDPRGLLLIGATAFACAAIIPPVFLPAPEPRRLSATLGNRAEIRTSTRKHLRLLLITVALTATTATLVDYAFKATIDQEIAPDQLGVFFSRFYLGLNLLSLIVQVALAPYLLRTLGVTRALMVLPLTLALGAITATFLGPVAAAVALRGADGGLRQSLHRSATELLYFPLSSAERKRHKASIDAIGQRSGQALGSLAIVGATIVGLGVHELSLVVIGLAGAWAVLAAKLRRGYLDLLRENLRAGVVETSPGVDAIDLHSLELLIASLNSEHDEEVLSTLELLVAHDRARLVPALLLYHPSRAVVLRTLEILGESGRDDFLAIARRLLAHPSSEIRAATMRQLAATLSPTELRAQLVASRPDATRDAVLTELVARGLDVDGSARRTIDERVRTGSVAQRTELARAIRLEGNPTFRPVLHALATRAEGELRREVARAFGVLRDESAVGTLIHWLGPRGARAESREALVAIGPPALAALSTTLADVTLRRELRGQLPRTIARFGTPQAVEILLEHLDDEPDGWIRYRILRALRSLRDVLPEHHFDAARLAAPIRAALHRACEVLESRLALKDRMEREPATRTASGEMLEPILLEKETQALDRAVRMVALSYPHEVMNGIVHAVRSSDRRLRAESRELLSNVGPPAVGAALVALLDDDATDAARLVRARDALGEPATPPGPGYAALLAELIADESEAVRCIAAFHAGELGLHELSGALREARNRAQRLSFDVITHALETLEKLKETRDG